MQRLSCPNCGAALPDHTLPNKVVTCEYCGVSFRVPDSLTPEPDMGDLLLGADFSDPKAPGWRLSTPERLEFKPGQPAELWARFPASKLIHPVVSTPGYFEDFDASVTIRLMEGQREQISAGMEVRSCDAGDYVIRVSAQGTFQVGWHNKTDWGGALVGWTEHPALRKELGASNRLRVVLRGDQIRVYLNGVLATSLRDGRLSAGTVRVVVTPGENQPVVVVFSDLQMREAL